jgi:hypothetical protein
MNSDSRMDRELRNLATLRPARSAWPELEKALNRQEKRQRRHSFLRFLLPGVAASVMVVALFLVNRAEDVSQALDMQKTVAKAVQDARPQASFSNLNLAGGQHNLEALLVSAKPRRPEINFLNNTADKSEKPAATGARQETIKEF